MKIELTSELLESKRREIGGTIADKPIWSVDKWAKYLGFRTKAKNKKMALRTRYSQLCNFLDGKVRADGKKYYNGPDILTMVVKKLKLDETEK